VTVLLGAAIVVMAWSGPTATIVVAHDNRIEAFDRTGATRLWSAKGLASPSAIAVSRDGTKAAILDGFADRVAVVSVADGTVALHDTPATPVAAAFFGRDVWIVLRDAGKVVRITPEGEKLEARVALDPAFLAVTDEFVYVYSRAEGLLQEIDPKSAQVTRSVSVGTAGSDLEIREPRPGEKPGAVAYLCRPASGTIVTVDLPSMERHDMKTGGAPVDLAFASDGKTLVIADAKAQRDRVAATSAGMFAFDSRGGTVYRIEGRNATKIAAGVASFVVTDESIFTWDAAGGRLRRL